MARFGRAQPHKPLILFPFITKDIQFNIAGNSGDVAAASSYSGSAEWYGSNRILTIDVSMLGPGVTVSAMTYGGAACTFIGSKSTVTSFGGVEQWRITQTDPGAPGPGANTLSVTLSGSIEFSVEWAAYTGVNQTQPTESFNSAQATNVGAADASVIITPIADRCWIHAAVVASDTSIAANQTSRNNISGTLGSGGNEDTGPITPAGATTMSYTNVGAMATWAIAGYALRPISAPGQETLQTITGKARIQATATQTITGKARVQNTSTQTISGTARIQKSVTATTTGVARITASATKTITGKAAIQNTTTKTIDGLARVTASTTRTITGTARIQNSVAQTITGKARIQATATQVITGLARIQKAATQVITGLARITASTLQTIAGKAAIQNTTSRTIQGLAKITTSVQQTIAGLARILKSASSTITGKSRIQKGVSATITGKARLNAAGSLTTTQTIDGKASIRHQARISTQLYLPRRNAILALGETAVTLYLPKRSVILK